ncbi:MAG: hypothetical protein NC301_02930 [Bacteroides sp.]|nr:hypothetical protein [Bacteroides sp.]MCM1378948.1 hypothetical protein [Bacteroides sp.]MCM1445564.1 hypothetical protein [Prevotella sp.]
MKKFLITFLTAVAAVSAFAAEQPRNRYTNVLEKVPLEGSYVGYAGLELLSPSYFGEGGVNFGVTTSHGAMVTNAIFLGGGVGYMQDFRNSVGAIPVFAEGRYFFQSQYQRRIYPHIGARAGAVIPTEGKVGYLVQLCVGFRVPLTENFAMNIEVGPQYASKYRRDVEQGYVGQTGEPFVKNGDSFGFFARINFEF